MPKETEDEPNISVQRLKQAMWPHSFLTVQQKGIFASFQIKRSPQPGASEALNRILQVGNNSFWQANVE